jgi:GGDEF domain-containing protein
MFGIPKKANSDPLSLNADDTPLWVEQIPRQRLISVAGTALGTFLIAFALLAGRDWTWATWVELAVGAISLAIVLISPYPSLAIVGIATVVVVEAVQHDGLALESVLRIAALVAALWAASYLRLGIRRRDNELAVAARTVGELTRRDRVARRLTRLEERSWIEAEVARARRYGYELSLALLRPDALPEEPAERQRVLEWVAARVGDELREGDAALRQDDDVFALALPHTPVEGARIACERIRLFAAASDDGHARTISVGIACFPQDASNLDAFSAAAETALARAIERGGNRTVLAQRDSDMPAGWSAVSPSRD